MYLVPDLYFVINIKTFNVTIILCREKTMKHGTSITNEKDEKHPRRNAAGYMLVSVIVQGRYVQMNNEHFNV